MKKVVGILLSALFIVAVVAVANRIGRVRSIMAGPQAAA